MNGWISIKERLPEKNEECWVTFIEPNGERLVAEGVLYDAVENKWFYEAGCHGCGFWEESVKNGPFWAPNGTFWPKPCKEEVA